MTKNNNNDNDQDVRASTRSGMHLCRQRKGKGREVVRETVPGMESRLTFLV